MLVKAKSMVHHVTFLYTRIISQRSRFCYVCLIYKPLDIWGYHSILPESGSVKNSVENSEQNLSLDFCFSILLRVECSPWQL